MKFVDGLMMHSEILLMSMLALLGAMCCSDMVC